MVNVFNKFSHSWQKNVVRVWDARRRIRPRVAAEPGAARVLKRGRDRRIYPIRVQTFAPRAAIRSAATTSVPIVCK